MFPWLLLLILQSAHSLDCPYVFYGKHYAKQRIVTIEGSPSFLQIEPTTDNLIFSLVTLNYELSGNMYILRNGIPVKVDINDAYVAATDFEHNRVFIGTASGLKLLNNQNKASPDFASIQNKIIIRLFKPIAEDKLFIITHPDNIVYQLDLNTFEKSEVKLEPRVHNVVVDADGNIFYRTESPNEGYKILLKGFTDSITFIRFYTKSVGLTIDDNNRVIAIVQNGLYWLKPDSVIPEKIANLDFQPENVLFDCDDIYISTLNAIYKFSNNDCY